MARLMRWGLFFWQQNCGLCRLFGGAFSATARICATNKRFLRPFEGLLSVFAVCCLVLFVGYLVQCNNEQRLFKSYLVQCNNEQWLFKSYLVLRSYNNRVPPKYFMI